MQTVNFPFRIVIVLVKCSHTLRILHSLSPVDPRQWFSSNGMLVCKAYFASPKSFQTSKILSDLQNHAVVSHHGSLKTSLCSLQCPKPARTHAALRLKYWCQSSFLLLPHLSCEWVHKSMGSSLWQLWLLLLLPQLCSTYHFPSRILLLLLHWTMSPASLYDL